MISSTHVVTSIAEEAAGTTYAIRGYCNALADLGDEVSLHCLEEVPVQCRFSVHTHRQWAIPARLGISTEMYRALRVAARRVDIMHAHSLWRMPSIYPAWATHGSRCRLVASPHGTLAPAAINRSRLAKESFWLLQRESLARAACLHATAEREYEHIRKMGISGPVAVVPIGIEVPELSHCGRCNGYKQLLFLGRIDRIKGVDMLIKTWSRMERSRPDWILRVVGPDNGGYLQELRNLSAELLNKRVSFEAGVYGNEKNEVFQSVDLYILPTLTENFGITVAEALANGVPSIVTKGAPWQGLETQGCGWWIERDENVLYDTLMEATSLSKVELQAMGERGRAWMQRDFSWNEVGRKMHLTYEWLLGGGPAPNWVRLR